jgi:hypothetical protein
MEDHVLPPWSSLPQTTRTIDIFSPAPLEEEDDFARFTREKAEKFFREFGPKWRKIADRVEREVE